MQAPVEIHYAGVVVGRAEEMREVEGGDVFIVTKEPLPVGTLVGVSTPEAQFNGRVAHVVETVDGVDNGMRVRRLGDGDPGANLWVPPPPAKPAPVPVRAASVEQDKAPEKVEPLPHGRVSWDQKDLIAFMKTYLGPLLAERLPKTEVWCGTMSKADNGGFDMAIAVATAQDDEAMKYVKGFGLQWNLHDVVTTLQAKNVPVMQTEHRCGNYNFGAPYWDQSRYSKDKGQNDHLYGEESWQGIRDWIVAGVNSYCAWNMVLDTAGKSLDGWPQNALLVVDKTNKKLIVTPAYYTFRHFSYYIAVGATRVGASASGDAYKGAGIGKYGTDKVAYDLVNAFAFKNPDGSVIVQLYNKASAAKKTTVDVGGGLYQFEVPAHGWATLRVPQ